MRTMQKRFKSKFLRGLYGELVLTQSFQKFTFFHLMFGVGKSNDIGGNVNISFSLNATYQSTSEQFSARSSFTSYENDA